MTILSESPTTQHGKARPETRADKAKALRERIDDSLDTLAKAVDDV